MRNNIKKMGRSCCCIFQPRCLLMATCFVQLLMLIERQIFDFMGQMWGSIAVNFMSIIICIIGIFGSQQHRIAHLMLYKVWQILLIAWNVFVICYYMEIGSIRRDDDSKYDFIFNFGTGSRSWWATNGPGCNPLYNLSNVDMTLINVTGCHVEYNIIESIQAAIHLTLSVLGLVMTSYILYIYLQEDDSSIARRSIGSGAALPPYSITIQPRTSSARRSTNSTASAPIAANQRRKRNRSSTRSLSSHATAAASRQQRNSVRKLKQRSRPSCSTTQSPVTKLLNNQYGDVSSLDSFAPYAGGPQTNPLYCRGSHYSLYSQHSTYTLNPKPTSASPLPPPPPPHNRPLSYCDYLQHQRQSILSNQPSPIYMNSETAI